MTRKTAPAGAAPIYSGPMSAVTLDGRDYRLVPGRPVIDAATGEPSALPEGDPFTSILRARGLLVDAPSQAEEA